MKKLSDIINELSPEHRTYVERKAQQLVEEMEAERAKMITTTEDRGEPSEHQHNNEA